MTEEKLISIIDNIKPNDKGCMLWPLGHRGEGYGCIWLNGKTETVHRVWYKLKKNSNLPDSQVILHTCDRHGCVNIDHLIAGSCADNSKDMKLKGRWRGGQPRKLSDAQIAEIKKLREEKNYSNKLLAYLYKVSPSYIWKIFNGTLTFKKFD